MLKQYAPLLPESYEQYIEPFVGGGALFFALEPQPIYSKGVGDDPLSVLETFGFQKNVLCDSNVDLMIFYRVIADPLGLKQFIELFHTWDINQTTYDKIRYLDPGLLTSVQRAARFFYLNKLCYNGMWRVNRKGIFNVNMGYDVSKIKSHGQTIARNKLLNLPNLELVHKMLNWTILLDGDFSAALTLAQPGDFVFLDPPYVPRDGKTSFVGYNNNVFGMEDQERLASWFGILADRGCKVMASNSDAEIVRELYKGWNITEVKSPRMISRTVESRAPITEVVIRNYE